MTLPRRYRNRQPKARSLFRVILDFMEDLVGW